ncbi:hypothetical protein BKA70DRAFT_1222683 [Coprinopsis sp. MPI-PUGE-AT-0042]|nr:hypothetical protein BKA70DRAFT_1222683 [Coprinopsis sp. MPI-PUGE-AT-0042]
MREFAVDHLKPRPRLPGLAWYEPAPGEPDDLVNSQSRFVPHKQIVLKGPTCGCSAKCCRPIPDRPVGLLSDEDHARIQRYLEHIEQLLEGGGELAAEEGDDDVEMGDEDAEADEEVVSPMRCSTAERENLRIMLTAWRDREWAKIEADNPFLSREWILTDEDVKTLVSKAHLVVNAFRRDAASVRRIIPKSIISIELLGLLAAELDKFVDKFKARQPAPTRPNKRRRPRGESATATTDPDDPFTANSEQHHVYNGNLFKAWKV